MKLGDKVLVFQQHPGIVKKIEDGRALVAFSIGTAKYLAYIDNIDLRESK